MLAVVVQRNHKCGRGGRGEKAARTPHVLIGQAKGPPTLEETVFFSFFFPIEATTCVVEGNR